MRRVLPIIIALVAGLVLGAVVSISFVSKPVQSAPPVGRYQLIVSQDDRHTLLRLDTTSGRVEKYVDDGGVMMGEWQEVKNWYYNPKTETYEFSANSLPQPLPLTPRFVPRSKTGLP